MAQGIKDLIAMRDIESLYELMSEDEDWMNQLDAADGLLKLGDPRGLEFVRSAEQSESRQVRDVAREILSDPANQSRIYELEAAERLELRKKMEVAAKRLKSGGKVFQYKMVYLPAGEIMDEDPLSEGFDVPALTAWGLEGWEVVNILSRRRQMLKDVVDDNMTGAYFLLKRELGPGDAGEL